jgi:hypothetical protein
VLRGMGFWVVLGTILTSERVVLGHTRSTFRNAVKACRASVSVDHSLIRRIGVRSLGGNVTRARSGCPGELRLDTPNCAQKNIDHNSTLMYWRFSL